MIKCEDVFPIGVETCGKRSLFLGGQDSSKTTQVLGGWNMANLLLVVCWNWYFWRDKVILDDFGPSTSSRAWHIWTNSGDVWWRSVFRLANGKHAHRGIIYRVNLCNFRSIEVQGDLYILFCVDLRESWGMILQRLGESFHGWQVQNDLASFATKGVLSYNHVTHASSVLLNGLFGSLIAPEYKIIQGYIDGGISSLFSFRFLRSCYAPPPTKDVYVFQCLRCCFWRELPLLPSLGKKERRQPSAMQVQRNEKRLQRG